MWNVERFKILMCYFPFMFYISLLAADLKLSCVVSLRYIFLSISVNLLFPSISVVRKLALSIRLFRQLQIKQRTWSTLQRVKACTALMSHSTRNQQCCDVTSENTAFSQSLRSGALASRVLSAPWTVTPPQQLNQHLPPLWLQTPIFQHPSPTLRGHCVFEAPFVVY